MRFGFSARVTERIPMYTYAVVLAKNAAISSQRFAHIRAAQYWTNGCFLLMLSGGNHATFLDGCIKEA